MESFYTWLKINEAKESIQYSKEFVKALEKYVDINDNKYLDIVIKNKQKIDKKFKKKGIYYRGMIVSDEVLEQIQKGKFTFDNITSWTTDPKIAEKFINDPKYRIGEKSGNKILLKKNISGAKIIINVYDFFNFLDSNWMIDKYNIDEIVLDSVQNEKETIVDKIKLSKKDIFKIL